jgi:nucleoside-diphosphate-sugar epimerase
MPDDTRSRGIVLLTGATGFVGRRLQTLLLDNDYAVRALVRHESPRAENIDPRAERIEGALDDPQALARGLVGTKAVINCAGAVRGNAAADFADVNVDGVRALAKAIERLSAPPALLHMSSLAASHPELSDYAGSKKAGEQVLEDFPELLWTVLRPPAIYGPGDVEMRPLLNLVRRGLVIVPGGNRQQRLSLLHVDDLANAVLAWLQAPARYRQYRYEIDDGHTLGYDWSEITEAVCTEPMFSRPLYLSIPGGLLNVCGKINEQMARLTRRKPMLTTGKARELTQPEWLCDNAPFSKTSGWTPAISLAAGVAALYEKDASA